MNRKGKIALYAVGLMLMPLLCNLSSPQDVCQVRSTLIPSSQDCDNFCDPSTLTSIIKTACEDSYSAHNEADLEQMLGFGLDTNMALVFDMMTCGVSHGTFFTYSPWLIMDFYGLEDANRVCKGTGTITDEEIEALLEDTPDLNNEEITALIKEYTIFQCFEPGHPQYDQTMNLINSFDTDLNSICDTEVPCQEKLWGFIGGENCVGLCENAVNQCGSDEDCYFNFYMQRLIDPDTNECLPIYEGIDFPDPFCETLRSCTETEFEIYH